MTPWTALFYLAAATLAGAVLGIERTYRGRAAGARTHALVAFASALLMAVIGIDDSWAPLNELVFDDGSRGRIVQGILTGIGFLGAGVIIKEGFTVHGLTTAASVWVTSALGVVIGSGHLLFGWAATLVALVILGIMKPIEDRMRSQHYLHCVVTCTRGNPMPEAALQALLAEHHCHITQASYDCDPKDDEFRYELVIWTYHRDLVHELMQAFNAQHQIIGYRFSPTRD